MLNDFSFKLFQQSAVWELEVYSTFTERKPAHKRGARPQLAGGAHCRMCELNACSLLTVREDSLESIRRQFARFPQGMGLSDFQSLVTSHISEMIDIKTGPEWRLRLGAAVGGAASVGEDGLSALFTKTLSRTGSKTMDSVQTSTGSMAAASKREKDHNLFGSRREASPSPYSQPMAGKLSCELEQQNSIQHLFRMVDGDSDGLITWDDLIRLAVEEATQSITCIMEETRSYSFYRKYMQLKLIRSVHGLPHHKSMFAVVTRAEPLVLLRRSDFGVIRKFTFEELENTYPTVVEYLPLPDMLISYSSCDKKLRGWWNITSPNHMGSLAPMCMDGVVRRLRTSTATLPYSFFTGSSDGHVVHWKVPKQRSVVELSHVHSYKNLHTRETGGITDFAIGGEWLYSTGFDRRVIAMHLENERVTTVGLPSETIRLMEYNAVFSSLLSVTYSNQLLLWDVRAAAMTTGNMFVDDTLKRHRGNVIGLCNAPGLSQVITADTAGRVKVWDLRVLRCVQTVCCDGSNGENTLLDFPSAHLKNTKDIAFQTLQGVDTSVSKSVHSLSYFANTQEVVCSSSEGIYSIRYNHHADSTVADTEVINFVAYDSRQDVIILQGATRTTVWDPSNGFRKRLFDRVEEVSIPALRHEVVAICLDPLRNRYFYAVGDAVEVRTSKEFALIEVLSLHKSTICDMAFSCVHNMLVSIAVDGSIAVRREGQSGLLTTTIVISSLPLQSLVISDDVGLIGCCDATHFHFVDYKQTALATYAVELQCSVQTMCFLGAFPIVAAGSSDSKLVFWSLPPLNVGYVQLASIAVNDALSVMEERYCERSFAPSSRDTASLDGASVMGIAFRSTRSLRTDGEMKSKVALCTMTSSSETERSASGTFLHDVCSKENASDGVTAITFDSVLHMLFVAVGCGKICIYSVCPLVQGYGIHPCSFEKRRRYQLRDASRDKLELLQPKLLRVISSHKTLITHVAWVPELHALLSCGGDSNVKVFDIEGYEVGQLLMRRLPPESAQDTTGGTDGTWQARSLPSEKFPPYSLPSATEYPTACENCMGGSQRGRLDVTLASELETYGDLKSATLPEIHGKQGNKVVSWISREAPKTAPGAPTGALSGVRLGVKARCSVVRSQMSSESLWLEALSRKRRWYPEVERSCGSSAQVGDSSVLQAESASVEVPRAKSSCGRESSASYAETNNEATLQQPLKLLENTLASLSQTIKWRATSSASVRKSPSATSSFARQGMILEGTSMHFHPLTMAPAVKGKATPNSKPRGRQRPIRAGRSGCWGSYSESSPNLKNASKLDSSETSLDLVINSFEKELRYCTRGGRRRGK
ncbi:hypothetical protein TRVL_03504 [Trypanosoma vivax]|uniref:EF-hand domain-containing protein n=1 Tax=Trypanosoma vivax (strain Y486) TaxID=1055687 RepID=G0U3C3_TRYVY|nr:hypothetical protein TRVL_03504 [Trypanosoma vivax]CCC50779.1 conserved hypothetical protein [Trypanosoma vivax Y486]